VKRLRDPVNRRDRMRAYAVTSCPTLAASFAAGATIVVVVLLLLALAKI
jgi:hypothetical protein